MTDPRPTPPAPGDGDRQPAATGWTRLLQTFTPEDFDDEHVIATLECVARLATTSTSEPFDRGHYRPDNPFAEPRAPVIERVSAEDRLAAIGFLAAFVTPQRPPAEGEDLAVTCARELWHRYDLYRLVFAIVVGSQGAGERDDRSPTPASVPAHRERLVALGILNALLALNRLGGPALQLPDVRGADDAPRSLPPSPN